MKTRYCTETNLDNFALNQSSGMFALRAFRLHERSKAAAARGRHRRADWLSLLSQAYSSRGIAVEHRLMGNIETALRLERMSETLLEEARSV